MAWCCQQRGGLGRYRVFLWWTRISSLDNGLCALVAPIIQSEPVRGCSGDVVVEVDASATRLSGSRSSLLTSTTVDPV